MNTKKPFDLTLFRAQQRNLFALLSRYGNTSYPVYTGDVAAAFSVNHRALKSAIEKDLLHLRKEFGPVFLMKAKKTGGMRHLNGYFMPASAIVSVLVEALGENLYSHCDEESLQQLM